MPVRQPGALRYLYQLDGGQLILTGNSGRDERAVLSRLTEGPHRFTVYAMDREGNQDLTGASAEFVVDSLAPIVSITAPKENAVIGDVYEIRGTAKDETDFLDYQIRIFPGDSTSGESFASLHFNRARRRRHTLSLGYANGRRGFIHD